MKYSVLICGQREQGLLRDLGAVYAQHMIFRDKFCAETVGVGTVQIRLVVDCDERTIAELVSDWKMTTGVQAVVMPPRGEEPPKPT